MAERFRGENPSTFDAEKVVAENARIAMREAREALEEAKKSGVGVEDSRRAVQIAAENLLKYWPRETAAVTEDATEDVKEAA